MKKILLFATPPLVLCVLALAAIPQYKIVNKIQIGGEVRRDDLFIDSVIFSLVEIRQPADTGSLKWVRHSRY